jgi:hypothetical protein
VSIPGGGQVAISIEIRSMAPDFPIIEVVSVGHFSIEDAMTARDAAWELSLASGIHNVLTDMTATTFAPPAVDIVEFARGMTTFGDPQQLRHAVVSPDDPMAATWIDLFATAEANRGLTARRFHDRDSAIAWLCDGA